MAGASDGGERSAFTEALAMLGRRDLSGAKLRDRLIRKGHSEEEAESACERCAEAGYLDDTRYGRMRAERRLGRRPSGRREISRDLRREGLDPTMSEKIADEVVEAAGGEAELLQAALERWLDRHGDPDDWRAAKRCFDHLHRRGFPRGLIRKALSPWLDSISG